MTIKQLIIELKKFDENSEVKINTSAEKVIYKESSAPIDNVKKVDDVIILTTDDTNFYTQD